MQNYVEGKVIIITGAGGGFGKLLAKKVSALGAKVVCVGRREENVKKVAEGIKEKGYEASYIKADVAIKEDMDAMVQFAVQKYGCVDVLVNNAAIMPTSFFADHAKAWQAWDQCIDINIKGVVHAIAAVYDQMIGQGQGHIINISSIAGNAPVVGGSVYQASKVAVNYISETVRQEARGKIKVSLVKPTAVAATGLYGTMINPRASIGMIGQNWKDTIATNADIKNRPDLTDREKIGFFNCDPEAIVDGVIYVINQPWGVNISDITVRAAGESLIM